MKHWFYIFFTGIVWLSMGLYLFAKGIDFLKVANLRLDYFILVLLISSSAGFLKEKFILKKTVKRITKRILSYALPIPIFRIYDSRFYIVILMMIILGQSLKWFSLSLIIRGGVDLAIGLALVKGGCSFLFMGISTRKISY